MALAAAFFWAMGQVLGKLVMKELDPITFSAIRFSSVALALLPVFLLLRPKTAGTWPTLLAVTAGLFGLAVALLILFYCMKRAPAHKVITIGNASPVWTALFAIFLIGEEINPLLPLSLALVVGGSLLFMPREKETDQWRFAVPLSMVSAILWGLDLVLRKMAINLEINVLAFIWISVVAAAALLNLISLLKRSWKGQKLSKNILALTLASTFFSHLATFLFMFALEVEKVSSLSPFSSAVIPFGFLLSILIIGEKPYLRAAVGMIVVLLGVILAAV
ncbi:MAG: DMT family transporter [Candidatus Hadarchaeum sp.]|uniref:DMT family transporter n=1 Tax=Candidatus Hadarchaeum sp. TaxID=2883567 RepID=UPI003D0BA83B